MCIRDQIMGKLSIEKMMFSKKRNIYATQIALAVIKDSEIDYSVISDFECADNIVSLIDDEIIPAIRKFDMNVADANQRCKDAFMDMIDCCAEKHSHQFFEAKEQVIEDLLQYGEFNQEDLDTMRKNKRYIKKLYDLSNKVMKSLE